MINLVILTSSRADFGIYEPLLKLLSNSKDIDTKIVAFGTHLSELYGYSVQHIKKTNIEIIAEFDTAPLEDTPASISSSMALTIQSMTSVWKKHKIDLLIALGDRYEMFAAVASAIPFNIKVAHIHGGETTLGAIDNAFRHSITHMSNLHFTASEDYYNRVIELTGSNRGVYNTGSLSIDSLSTVSFLTKEEISEQYKIDFSRPVILITLHPETLNLNSNSSYATEVIKALSNRSDTQQVITMPNADTSGLIIREKLNLYANQSKNVILVENFGSRAYLSIMKYASLLLGNSSSGFIEAAWFPKWVINIGDRQKGRIRTPNIIDVPFESDLIDNAISKALSSKTPEVKPIYGTGNAAEKILKHILNEFTNN